MCQAVRMAVLETLPKGKKFWREKECEREGTVIEHGAGGSLVEFYEPHEIRLKTRTIQTHKKKRVQIARKSRVWVREKCSQRRGD